MECESFTAIFYWVILLYENKYYLQVYLSSCAYKIVNKEIIDYLDKNLLEGLAAVSWNFGCCSVQASLKIWWITLHEH